MDKEGRIHRFHSITISNTQAKRVGVNEYLSSLQDACLSMLRLAGMFGMHVHIYIPARKYSRVLRRVQSTNHGQILRK
jgi:hypothetical protein